MSVVRATAKEEGRRRGEKNALEKFHPNQKFPPQLEIPIAT